MAKPKGATASAARTGKARDLPRGRQGDARAAGNGLADASLARGREGSTSRLETLACAALERLLKDKATPAAALASAIRTALQLSGALEREREPELPSDPESMSAADIDAALQSLLHKRTRAPQKPMKPKR